MLKIQGFTVNPIQENTYIVSDSSGEAAIIDCGALFPEEQKAIADYISAHRLRPTLLLLTHGHFDHVFGCAWAAETYGLTPYMHPADEPFFAHAARHAEHFLRSCPDFTVPSRFQPIGTPDSPQTLPLGTHTLRVLHTPGHTPGGVCFYEADEKVLFSGDTIFEESIGRTDLGGKHEQLIHSIRTELLTLPDDVQILPGHGGATTIGHERRYNPFLP